MSGAVKPTLVILAAGIGRRYGGLKQIAPVGPSGEVIIDYSIYDALAAGFGKLVFVINHELEAAFREHIGGRFESRAEVVYAFQELSSHVPPDFSVPSGRSKPWGTGHAILVCRDLVGEPFCVINADDFYGAEAYRVMADYLRNAAEGAYAMVGFKLRKTLSAHGSVARGVCRVDGRGRLQSVVERTRIEVQNGSIRFLNDAAAWQQLNGDDLVSMNIWGFTPGVFAHLQARFDEFLSARGVDPQAEFFIPTVVDGLVRAGRANVRVLESGDQWFGVTYPEDKALVVNSIRALVNEGVYPERLWN